MYKPNKRSSFARDASPQLLNSNELQTQISKGVQLMGKVPIPTQELLNIQSSTLGGVTSKLTPLGSFAELQANNNSCHN